MGLSIPVTILTGAGNQLVSAGAGRIVFVSVLETSGVNPASFTLFDGAIPTNRGFIDFNVNAAGSTREPFEGHGLPFEGDLWLGNIVGVATCRIHVVPEDLWTRWRADYWRGLEAAALYGAAV